ncbi:hypothetical protein [Tsukamurella asaccharolytica]|uniref:hypothetical protein n=1 Tax=Tsukamurella asaccharolytica TaxID=2592067 RepID=UPI0018786E15|nr:hypothetical protein [Tsukamurella asaccharolytica]
MSAETESVRTRGVSPALLVAGIAALAIAAWGIVGGPRLIDAGTLLGILAIGAVVVAGVTLIRPRRGSDSAPPTAPGSSPDGH